MYIIHILVEQNMVISCILRGQTHMEPYIRMLVNIKGELK